MSTRKIIVIVDSYPADIVSTLSCKRLLAMHENFEFKDIFISSKSLEQLLSEYIDKVDVYASFVDDIRSYRIVLIDNERRIYKFHKV